MSRSAPILHFALVAALLGCTDTTVPVRAVDGELTQAQADAILSNCGAPKGSLVVEMYGALRFEPAPSLSYETSACILKAVRDSGASKFGFIGNERAPEPEDH